MLHQWPLAPSITSLASGSLNWPLITGQLINPQSTQAIHCFMPTVIICASTQHLFLDLPCLLLLRHLHLEDIFVAFRHSMQHLSCQSMLSCLWPNRSNNRWIYKMPRYAISDKPHDGTECRINKWPHGYQERFF